MPRPPTLGSAVAAFAVALGLAPLPVLAADASAGLSTPAAFGDPAANPPSPVLSDVATSPAPAGPARPPQEIGAVTVDRGPAPVAFDQRPRDVITAAQIAARGARTLADALTLAPGVAVLRYGGLGATSTLSVDGSNQASSILVLLDGLPLNLGSTGGVDPSTVSTVGIERIEVYRGGASTLYGANAVAGVVNLVTSRDPKLSAALAQGSFGATTLRAAQAFALGRGTLGVAAERNRATNKYPYAAASSFGSSAGYAAGSRANADAALNLGRLTYDTQLGRALHLHAIAGSNSLTLGIPGGTSFLTPDARSNLNGNVLGASLERRGAHSTSTLALSSVAQNLSYHDARAVGVGFDEDTTQDRRTDFALRHAIGDERSRVVFGASVTRETTRLGFGLSAQPGVANVTSAAQTQSAIYTQYARAFGVDGKYYVGLRAENDRPQGGAVAPALGGVLPLGALRVQADASVAYRVPTLVDLYYPGFSNPGLLPERSQSVDVNVSAPSVVPGLSIGGFTRTTRNRIAPDATFTPRNIARASIAGLRLGYGVRAPGDLFFTLGYTQTFRALDVTNPAAPTRLTFVPWSTTTFALERPVRDMRVGFGVTGQVYGPTEQFGGARSPGFATVDSYVRVPVSRAAIVSLRARNLGDEKYEIVNGYPMPGRGFEVELATR